MRQVRAPIWAPEGRAPLPTPRATKPKLTPGRPWRPRPTSCLCCETPGLLLPWEPSEARNRQDETSPAGQLPSFGPWGAFVLEVLGCLAAVLAVAARGRVAPLLVAASSCPSAAPSLPFPFLPWPMARRRSQRRSQCSKIPASTQPTRQLSFRTPSPVPRTATSTPPTTSLWCWTLRPRTATRTQLDDKSADEESKVRQNAAAIGTQKDDPPVPDGEVPGAVCSGACDGHFQVQQGVVDIDAEHRAQKESRAAAGQRASSTTAASANRPTDGRGANCWGHRRAPAIAGTVPFCLLRALAPPLLPPPAMRRALSLHVRQR